MHALMHDSHTHAHCMFSAQQQLNLHYHYALIITNRNSSFSEVSEHGLVSKFWATLLLIVLHIV